MRIVDLGESSADRLARAVRHRLRRGHGIEDGIPVVLSTERPRCELVPAGDDPAANPLDYQARARRRVPAGVGAVAWHSAGSRA